MNVIIVPLGRSEETNQKEAKELLHAGGYPANPDPWIAPIEGTKEAYVSVIDDFDGLLKSIMNGPKIGDPREY